MEVNLNQRLQQDSTSSHIAHVTHKWLSKNFYTLIPPNTPDLNSLDYYIRIGIKWEINHHPQITKNSLKANIINVIGQMSKKHLIQECSHFQGHMKVILEAVAGFIEYLFSKFFTKYIFFSLEYLFFFRL